MRNAVISFLTWLGVLALGAAPFAVFFYLGWAAAVALAESTPLPV